MSLISEDFSVEIIGNVKKIKYNKLRELGF